MNLPTYNPLILIQLLSTPQKQPNEKHYIIYAMRKSLQSIRARFDFETPFDMIDFLQIKEGIYQGKGKHGIVYVKTQDKCFYSPMRKRQKHQQQSQSVQLVQRVSSPRKPQKKVEKAQTLFKLQTLQPSSESLRFMPIHKFDGIFWLFVIEGCLQYEGQYYYSGQSILLDQKSTQYPKQAAHKHNYQIQIGDNFQSRKKLSKRTNSIMAVLPVEKITMLQKLVFLRERMKQIKFIKQNVIFNRIPQRKIIELHNQMAITKVFHGQNVSTVVKNQVQLLDNKSMDIDLTGSTTSQKQASFLLNYQSHNKKKILEIVQQLNKLQEQQMQQIQKEESSQKNHLYFLYKGEIRARHAASKCQLSILTPGCIFGDLSSYQELIRFRDYDFKMKDNIQQEEDQNNLNKKRKFQTIQEEIGQEIQLQKYLFKRNASLFSQNQQRTEEQIHKKIDQHLELLKQILKKNHERAKKIHQKIKRKFQESIKAKKDRQAIKVHLKEDINTQYYCDSEEAIIFAIPIYRFLGQPLCYYPSALYKIIQAFEQRHQRLEKIIQEKRLIRQKIKSRQRLAKQKSKKHLNNVEFPKFMNRIQKHYEIDSPKSTRVHLKNRLYDTIQHEKQINSRSNTIGLNPQRFYTPEKQGHNTIKINSTSTAILSTTISPSTKLDKFFPRKRSKSEKELLGPTTSARQILNVPFDHFFVPEQFVSRKLKIQYESVLSRMRKQQKRLNTQIKQEKDPTMGAQQLAQNYINQQRILKTKTKKKFLPIYRKEFKKVDRSDLSSRKIMSMFQKVVQNTISQA